VTARGILSRATVFYAGHFVSFMRVTAIVWIPVSIAQALALQLALDRNVAALTVGLVAIVLGPIGTVALIVVAAGQLEHAPVGAVAALRRGLALWLPTTLAGFYVVLWFLWWLFVGVIVFAIVSALVAFVAWAVIGSPADNWASFETVLIGVAALVGVLGAAPFIVVFGMASVAVALEDHKAFEAARRAIQRACDRQFRRSTFLLGLSYIALDWIVIGFSSVVAGVVAAFTQSPFALAFASALPGAAIGGALSIVALVYTRDIRAQREGADLAAAVDDPEIAGRELIDRFLARRDSLAPQARAELAARIGRRVRPNLQASFDHLDDEALFEHLARTL